MFKSSIVLNYETYHPELRWIAKEIRMDFKRYLLLDAAHEVEILCESYLDFRDGKVSNNRSTTCFRQFGQIGCEIYFDCMLATPQLEEKLEQRARGD